VDKDKREEILDQFRSGETEKLLVVDALNEGVDVPKMNCLVFLRSTSSEIIWKQQLGRGLRNPDQSGEEVKVLDFVGNCRRVLQVSELSETADSFNAEQVISTDEDETTDEIETEKLNLSEEQVDLIEVVEQLEVLRGEFYGSYDQAREAVQNLDPTPTTFSEYQDLYKQDPRLPYEPNQKYPDDWQGWRHFLGTEFYPTLEEAKQAVQELDPVPSTKSEYCEVYRQDPKLTSGPKYTYPNKWSDWSEFLETGFYSTLGKAKEAVQDLDPVPKSGPQYQQVYKQDDKLPSQPGQVYSDDWQGWRHFLGTDIYPTYQKAKNAVQDLEPVPNSSNEYFQRYKQDERLPYNPHKQYPNEWTCWGDFLEKYYSTYQKAKEAVQDLDPVPTTSREYVEVYKQDHKLPGSPSKVYSDEWQGWRHFLGKEKYPTLEKAKQAVKKLDPQPESGSEYHNLYDQDPKLPASPDQFYSDGWKGWRHFLGTERWSYGRVKEYVQSKGFKTLSEYKEHARNHPNLKVSPSSYDEYEGATEFFGKG